MKWLQFHKKHTVPRALQALTPAAVLPSNHRQLIQPTSTHA